MSYLEGKHTIFGYVAEGLDVLDKINNLYTDARGRPYQDCRILHTYVLDDPFPEGPSYIAGPQRCSSPEVYKPPQEVVRERLPYGEAADEGDGISQEDSESAMRKRKREDARSRAVVLEMIGDLPDAEARPEDNVLFVCKLNSITEADDLEIIFSRFGDIKSCDVIRDAKTGESLNYAFVEFATKAQCEEAYLKMNNVLIDDRRIKVDFSQSVAKLWSKWRTRSTNRS